MGKDKYKEFAEFLESPDEVCRAVEHNTIGGNQRIK
jgi:hypothetical protein